jgi:hypothetical protein
VVPAHVGESLLGRSSAHFERVAQWNVRLSVAFPRLQAVVYRFRQATADLGRRTHEDERMTTAGNLCGGHKAQSHWMQNEPTLSRVE